MTETYVVTAQLWLWESDKAPARWHFLSIDGEVAEAIHALALMRRLESGQKRGWGALKVHVTIGTTSWDTSVFPNKSSGGWLLPVKAAVRKAEVLVAGDEVQITVTL